MATQDDYIRTALRVPPDLHAQIHEAAKGNNRTFNAEIVARLEGSFAMSAFPARDQDELDAMVDISMAQMKFHMAQNRVAEARDEFTRARIRYDALVIQEDSAPRTAPPTEQALKMKDQRLAALAEAEQAQLKLKEAESAYHEAQKALSDWHVARLKARAKS